MTYRNLLKQGTAFLQEKQIEDADFDALQLLLFASGLDRTTFCLRTEEAVTASAEKTYLTLLQRRADGEPLQYLLGEWDFYGLPFYVGPGVLIPRPETETLVDLALSYLQEQERKREREQKREQDREQNKDQDRKPNRDQDRKQQKKCWQILDLCAGSGCIGIALLKKAAEQTKPIAIHVTFLEKSEQAAGYLRQNLHRHGLEHRSTVLVGDLCNGFSAFSSFPGVPASPDLLISNPPYLRTAELETLQPELQKEPVQALDGGPDGLLFYRVLQKQWLPALAPGAFYCVEGGEDQAEQIAALFRPLCKTAEIKADAFSVRRFVYGIK